VREMEDRWPSSVGLRGQALNHPGAALAEDCRGERPGRRRDLIASGGDREDVPEASGRGSLVGRSPFEASKSRQMTSKPGGFRFSLGMSLAGARVLARRCPAYRRRDPGLRLLPGTWEGVR
jgi:hypothetical protein